MRLILEIVLLLLGAGGAVVTGFTLPNSRAKWLTVSGFTLLGLVGFVLIILNYWQSHGGSTEAVFAVLGNVTFSILQNPTFQIAAAFSAGVIVTLIVIRNPFRTKIVVRKWLTPREAVQEFVDPQILLECQRANERLSELRQAALAAEAEYQREHSFDSLIDPGVGQKKNNAIRARNDAEFVALRQRAAVMENLRSQLGSGQLVAKGYEVKKGVLSDQENYILPVFWRIVISGRNLLNLEKENVEGPYQSYQAISIGKNLAFKGSQSATIVLR